MNWKDYPHLFVNGKFRVEADGSWHEILGLRGSLYQTLRFGSSTFEGVYLPYDCQLIARPISDMTDEELIDCPHLVDTMYEIYNYRPDNSFAIPHLRERLIGMLYRFDIKMYLLSIGVYPLDDDTDVIYK